MLCNLDRAKFTTQKAKYFDYLLNLDLYIHFTLTYTIITKYIFIFVIVKRHGDEKSDDEKDWY